MESGYALLVIFFWSLFFIISYVYFGYPLVLLVLSVRKAGAPHRDESYLPSVSLLIPAYNEASGIRNKIENSLALDYPEENLEIIVASDGSTDDTNKIAAGYSDRGVRLLVAAERGGKNSVINAFLSECRGEIIVFTDANSFYYPDAVRKLVRNFCDQSIGCVAGKLTYREQETSVGKGEGLYFRYETMLKELENRFGTVVAAAGAIYAIRKSAFTNIDLDVPNDLIHPIQMAAKGFKVVFERDAAAYEKATSSAAEEFRRRARIVTQGITAFMRYRSEYRMLRGIWGFCFLSHKLLRWFVPFLLIAMFITNLLISSLPISPPFLKLTLYAQTAFYFTAGIAFFLGERKTKLLAVPLYYCLINLAAFVGILRYYTGDRQVAWEVAKTTR